MTPGNDTSGQPMRLRANRIVVETKCLTCNNAFAYSEEVCACPQCGGYHHARCWDYSQGCSHQAGAAAPYQAAAAPFAYGPVEPQYAAPPPPPPPQYQPMPPAPPPFQQQVIAADEQFCPGCRNIVKIGALRCRFCNYSFSYMPGMQGPPMFTNHPPPPYGGAFPNFGAPYGLQFDLEARASGARACGLVSIILFGSVFLIVFLMAAADAREPAGRVIGSLSGLIFIASLTLAIVAVVKGHGARRLLDQFPHDYRVRGRATAGIVMGWIVIGLFGLFLVLVIVLAAANYR